MSHIETYPFTFNALLMDFDLHVSFDYLDLHLLFYYSQITYLQMILA